MSRNPLIAVVVIALVSCTILSAGDVYTGPKPTTKTSALDNRTELQKLQGQVNEMSYFLDEAFYVIDEHEERIDELETALAQNKQFIADLKSCITVDGASVTVAAARINLDAGLVDINAGLVNVDGEFKSDNVITDTVTANSYTPGAGNIW